jgi:hypothetical protein
MKTRKSSFFKEEEEGLVFQLHTTEVSLLKSIPFIFNASAQLYDVCNNL